MRHGAFFVAEEEYPKLQAACPGDFPFTYAEFTKRVDDGIKASGMDVVKVNINIDEFLAWCAETKVKPINTSRARYAALIAHKLGLN